MTEILASCFIVHFFSLTPKEYVEENQSRVKGSGENNVSNKRRGWGGGVCLWWDRAFQISWFYSSQSNKLWVGAAKDGDAQITQTDLEFS